MQNAHDQNAAFFDGVKHDVVCNLETAQPRVNTLADTANGRISGKHLERGFKAIQVSGSLTPAPCFQCVADDFVDVSSSIG